MTVSIYVVSLFFDFLLPTLTLRSEIKRIKKIHRKMMTELDAQQMLPSLLGFCHTSKYDILSHSIHVTFG